MTKRIFRSICLVAIAVFLASFVLIMGVLYDCLSSLQMKSLKTETELCASAVEDIGIEYLKSVSDGDYRITWIAADGKVLYDSKVKTGKMENHLKREEIKAALEHGEGESARRSDTLMEKQLYSARKLEDGTILRLSASYLSLWSLILSMLQPILIVMVFAVSLSLFLAYRLSKHVVAPLNRLDLDSLQAEDVYEEIVPLVTRIKNQQQLLKIQQTKLEQKQEEFDTATGYMNEGIILLTKNGKVLSINSSAMKVLDVTKYCIGKDLMLFSSSEELRDLLRIAGEGRHSEKIIPTGIGSYQFNASPVMSDGRVSGIALIILDITEKEKAEESRREFTANVSHELKTPLQNISGSAELLANGLVQAKDVPKFAEQIVGESRRMITLVEDIINLSHLDEGAEDMERQMVDLYEIAKITVDRLMPAAKAAGVNFALKGEACKMEGIPQMLSAIVYNLCDNAIKYNRVGGSVNVEVKSEKDDIMVRVEDTGIGIPAEAQGRIFERFYRVDKSHSKEVGGTGLGLSIVKHAVKLHEGTIVIQSNVDQGTRMIITLPKGDRKR